MIDEILNQSLGEGGFCFTAGTWLLPRTVICHRRVYLRY